MKLIVKDMMCNHCVQTISSKLEREDIEANIDLANKTVEIKEGDEEIARKVISAAGFHIEN